MGSIFGGSTSSIARPDYSEMNHLMNNMWDQVNNDPTESGGRQTTGQRTFGYMAGQSLQNTLQGQSASRGIRASQMASMANNALSNQQAQLAGQAAIRDAAEREAAQNSLAGIYMQQQGQKIAVDQANAQIEQQNQAAQDRMLGMGLTAAGYAFGGPAGGMAAGALTSGMGSGGSAPTNMGANPYAGAAPQSQSMQYNPSQYNMGQGLKFQGGY